MDTTSSERQADISNLRIFMDIKEKRLLGGKIKKNVRSTESSKLGVWEPGWSLESLVVFFELGPFFPLFFSPFPLLFFMVTEERA